MADNVNETNGMVYDMCHDWFTEKEVAWLISVETYDDDECMHKSFQFKPFPVYLLICIIFQGYLHCFILFAVGIFMFSIFKSIRYELCMPIVKM